MLSAQPTLLEGLLHTQDLNNQATEYTHLRIHAHNITVWARQFSNPVLIAVDPTSQRLIGAATLLARGDLKTPVFSHRLDGETVLLVASIAATPVDLDAAAAHARRRGAHSVHGCAIHIETSALPTDLDSFTLLNDVSDTQMTA